MDASFIRKWDVGIRIGKTSSSLHDSSLFLGSEKSLQKTSALSFLIKYKHLEQLM